MELDTLGPLPVQHLLPVTFNPIILLRMSCVETFSAQVVLGSQARFLQADDSDDCFSVVLHAGIDEFNSAEHKFDIVFFRQWEKQNMLCPSESKILNIRVEQKHSLDCHHV